MAGPAQRGSRGRGRSPRVASSSPSAAIGSAVASGSTRPSRAAAAKPDPDQQAAAVLITGSTYRLLLMRGLEPEEAANLTAFLCGIPIGEVHWSLRQVNQLLFLREMARTGRFGRQDGGAPRPN